MPLRHRSLNKSGTFFITSSTDKRIYRFNSADEYNIVLSKLEYYRNRDSIQLHGFVVMPNHIHLLMTIPDNKDVSDFIVVCRRVAVPDD